MKRGSILVALCCALLISSWAWAKRPATTPATSGEDIVVITDIKKWEHPTKRVFEKYKLELKKVELQHQKKYPLFYLAFPWDPRTGPNGRLLSKIEAEVFVANGRHNFAIQDDDYGIRLEITAENHGKSLHESIEDLTGESKTW